MELIFHPLTKERWKDFEALFGKHGAYGGCWCMWWRSTRKEFEANQGEGNLKIMKSIVESGTIPGILAYLDGKPVGWCSIAPREHYGAFERSRVMKRIDDQPVWSLPCFYISKTHKKQGIGTALIAAAIEYVREQGGKIIEAYPTVPKSESVPPVSSFMGFPKMFEKAGFKEVARPSASRIIMRYSIKK